jgi:hypothetical protein
VAIVRPRWASWSFLLYAGGLTILGAAGVLLSYLADAHGDAGYTAYALLIYAAAAAAALLLRRDGAHPVAAGIAAVIAVAMFAAFVGSIYSWFGWLDRGDSAFHGFDLARLTIALFTLGAALVALRLFRFPLLVLVATATGWYLVTDLLSGGGNWSATVTFLVGLAFLATAVSLDTGGHHPYAFWLHVAAGLTIGGSLLYFLHDGDFEWALIVLGGVLYVALADRFARSSWAVLGAIGILAATAHYAKDDAVLGLVPFLGFGSGGNGWRGPVVFAVAGLGLMLLGGALAHRNRATP